MNSDSNSDYDKSYETEEEAQLVRMKMNEEARGRRDGIFLSLVSIGTSIVASYYLKYLIKQQRRVSRMTG